MPVKRVLASFRAGFAKGRKRCKRILNTAANFQFWLHGRIMQHGHGAVRRQRLELQGLHRRVGRTGAPVKINVADRHLRREIGTPPRRLFPKGVDILRQACAGHCCARIRHAAKEAALAAYRQFGDILKAGLARNRADKGDGAEAQHFIALAHTSDDKTVVACRHADADGHKVVAACRQRARQQRLHLAQVRLADEALHLAFCRCLHICALYCCAGFVCRHLINPFAHWQKKAAKKCAHPDKSVVSGKRASTFKMTFSFTLYGTFITSCVNKHSTRTCIFRGYRVHHETYYYVRHL